MDCTSALELLNARLDGELDSSDEPRLREHLAHCAECRDAEVSLTRVDEQLRALVPDAAAIERIVAGLGQRPVMSRSTRGGFQSLLVVLAAMAAMIVLAIIMWRPFKPAQPGKETGPQARAVEPAPKISPAPHFEITLARGQVEMRKAETVSWTVLKQPQTAQADIGCSLRTSGDSQFEMVCPDGCVVRVDANSEINLNGADVVDLRKGRLWAKAPERQQLNVFLCPAQETDPLTANLNCHSASCVQASVEEPRNLSMMVAEGKSDVEFQSQTIPVEAGFEIAMTPEGQQKRRAYDPLGETSWMAPLLALRGGEDREVQGRVTSLLAQIGATKLSYAYEDQLRQLGGAGAIPLIAFLRSPLADNDPQKQYAVARIIGDTAPESSIPDLVALLDHTNSEVRIAAATALQRLTGLTHGVEPSEWRDLGEKQMQAARQWRAWLKQRGMARDGIPNRWVAGVERSEPPVF